MKDNKNLGRYERAIGDAIVFANYRLEGKTLYINYIEAPEALRGTGEAGKLMADIMDYAQDAGLKVYPICSYAVAWLRRNPQYSALMAA